MTGAGLMLLTVLVEVEVEVEVEGLGLLTGESLFFAFSSSDSLSPS